LGTEGGDDMLARGRSGLGDEEVGWEMKKWDGADV
jgi:hypothetical protein